MRTREQEEEVREGEEASQGRKKKKRGRKTEQCSVIEAVVVRGAFQRRKMVNIIKCCKS